MRVPSGVAGLAPCLRVGFVFLQRQRQRESFGGEKRLRFYLCLKMEMNYDENVCYSGLFLVPEKGGKKGKFYHSSE